MASKVATGFVGLVLLIVIVLFAFSTVRIGMLLGGGTYDQSVHKYAYWVPILLYLMIFVLGFILKSLVIDGRS
jgi:hypothetical protein